MGKYESLAKEIVKNVGGKENIITLEHCVTRLRFQLKDEDIANTDILKKMDGVVTVMKSGGQYQVVIGNHVPDVFKDVCEVAGISSGLKETGKKKMSFGAKLLDLVTGIFMPSVGILCASGILKGVNILLEMCGLVVPDMGLYSLLAAAADAMFLFFPAILGYNAFKKLGGNPILGLTLGAALCYPAIQGVDLSVFGMTVNASYQNTVLPIILLSFVACPFEKWLNKVIPDAVKAFLTPAIVLMVCLPLGFCVIGPIANVCANGITIFFSSVYSFSPILACALLAGLWQILVLMGVHGVLVLAIMADLIAGNPQPLMAACEACSYITTGAVIAIWLKTKSSKLKSIALPAWISGIFGVTEPAIYGVTLPNGFQFGLTCIVSVIMGAVTGILGVKYYTLAGLGIFGIPGMIDSANPNGSLIAVIILLAGSTVAGFVAAFVTFRDNADVKESPKKENENRIQIKKEVLSAPLNGKVIPLTEVEDEAFSGEALGRGIAIEPVDGKVVAPCDGTVMTLFPTKHAIGIVSDNGAEVLIHLGLDTVKLDGKGFTAHVTQGDKVKKGQILVTVDLKAISEAGYSMVTPMIITNTSDYLDVVPMVSGEVKAKEELVTLII